MSRGPGPRRPGANGPGEYSNGYGGYGGYEGGRDESDGQRPSGESRRDRRPGGYGGFVSPPEEDRQPGVLGGYSGYEENGRRVGRPPSLERSHARRRSDEMRYHGDSSRSRNRQDAGRYGAGSQQMEEILKYIHENFDFMTNEKCVPIEIALKLMDSSSLGLADQFDRFQSTHQDLQRALKAIVNEHHQGFNSSIGTFHKIQNSLQVSQYRVRALKDSLALAKSQLSTTKPELKEFATTSQGYDEMIQMLNMIEQLQLVPDKLEARISEKQFLKAVDILQDALRMIRRSDMQGIGALSELRIYLSNQEHSLTDILIEELHNHLYLKSPYCEDRWKMYAHNQSKGELSERVHAEGRGRPLYDFLERLDPSEPMSDDSPRNPEADTFSYLQLLIESLNKMDRLDIAVDTIEQRLPMELFKVVEKSNNEVAQRHPSVLRAYASRKNAMASTTADNDELRTSLLKDLLWTLYARFEAIAEGHRVVHDVISGVVRREGIGETTSATLTRGFKELWKLYQSEMRSLLHDYLATDGDLSYRGGQGKAANGSPFSRAPRDRNKRMFKLADMDLKSTELTTEREDLEFILKSSVPGLVSDSKRPEEMNENNNSSLDGSATGHKLLVEPSVFNMGTLLPPSLEFLNRLKEVVPPGTDIVMSTLTSFLDDFLVNVFQPQLDETLAEMAAQTFIDLDAFQQEPQWAQYSKKPIFKGTAKFFQIVTAFCKMLDNLPHDQAFSHLIIAQMNTYADKCNGWYKALVSRSHPTESGRRIRAAAAYAESGELAQVISSLMTAESATAQDLADEEVSLLLAETEKDPLDQVDMIEEKKNIVGLCLLYTSMKWLATKLAQLRHISDRATDSSHPESGSSHVRHSRRWTLLSSTEPLREGLPVYLPLNKETAQAFDAVLTAYNTLSTTSLKTLHLALRTQIIHSLSTSLPQNKPYTLDTPLNDPDPAILALNTTLIAFDTLTSSHVPASVLPFLTSHLAPLMDACLLHLASSRLASLNENGAKHMQLNILVLQQNLKTISPEPDAGLPAAALWFDLFLAGPEEVVKRAKKEGKGFGVRGTAQREAFGYEGVKRLVEMGYREMLGDERREVGVGAKRRMDSDLLEISEALY
ncbi:uncharacterized protein EI97DRAFT_469769 [Westerdykella ornata]|uniref:Exocyst complex component Sec8 n=1 Tax=Westerdykella ornata TaxID=318751 RepID=A0A6A6JAC6_WESOR|nr:uncharacterized protein EI97DRAFT_469769 [Westerdykella ornata]KAF2273194.1 hypothetical protein EI97DRAFT_469769 [Westerdykella ornata]